MTGAVLWCRLDVPGHDTCRVAPAGDGWRLVGTAVFASGEGPSALAYEVTCDGAWRTRSARVTGHVGERAVDVALAADGDGHWQVDGVRRADLDGCLDVDLGFTPATNLLPVRRLGLEVGEGAPIRAAWVRVPSLRVEVLDQTYRRERREAYHYSSGSGFETTLKVGEVGFALDYPPFWQAESCPPS